MKSKEGLSGGRYEVSFFKFSRKDWEIFVITNP